MQKRGVIIAGIASIVATLIYAIAKYAASDFSISGTAIFLIAFWIIFYIIERFIAKKLD